MTAPTGDDALREALDAVLVPAVGAQMPRGKTWLPDPILDALLPVVLRYGREKAAEELEKLAFLLVSQDVQDGAVYEEIGALRDALTAQDPTEDGGR